MGGHAFPRLQTPRIPKELYLEIRDTTRTTLKRIFRHVAVPIELPSKSDFGDIDFLVGGPLTATQSSTFDYQYHVSLIKTNLNTAHGRKGFKVDKTMFFAVPLPDCPNEFFQVDVKVCERPDMFEWEHFQLVYASAAKILGSMAKPLGLTIDPEGLHLRVEGMDQANMSESMVFLTKSPKEVIKLIGLDKRILNSGFTTNEELFRYLTGSWIFNPAHFAERLNDESYVKHLLGRSAPFAKFVRDWIPEQYPGYAFNDTPQQDLHEWYRTVRSQIRDRSLTMYPSVAQRYYEKRQAHIRNMEEERLRQLLMKAIPLGVTGWSQDLPQPHTIITFAAHPSSPVDTTSEVLTPINTAIESPGAPSSMSRRSSETIFDEHSLSPSSRSSASSGDLEGCSLPARLPQETPLIVEGLSRDPPDKFKYKPNPPPANLSIEAKLHCVARWTLFSPDGSPYLTQSPRDKKFQMGWADSGSEDDVLVQWVCNMWWPIWLRQSRVNWTGMWKKRFKKEDARKARQEMEKFQIEEKEREESQRIEKIMKRLRLVNESMGFAPET